MFTYGLYKIIENRLKFGRKKEKKGFPGFTGTLAKKVSKLTTKLPDLSLSLL